MRRHTTTSSSSRVERVSTPLVVERLYGRRDGIEDGGSESREVWEIRDKGIDASLLTPLSLQLPRWVTGHIPR